VPFNFFLFKKQTFLTKMNKSYKLSLKTIVNALPLLATTVHAQNPTVSYATWKNNAKAAYTIVHDDFGNNETSGIARYADEAAYSRGIKFCFGAITRECDGNDWSDARRMRSHGHEVVNHSHSHRCSYQPGWCDYNNLYSSSNFSVELDGSTSLIEQNVGERPRFFIHPYDLSTQEVLDRLKSLGYLGARSGGQGSVNNPYFNDFFHLNYYVYAPGSNLNSLNQAVQTAVATGGYSMYELHGVEDKSWGQVPLWEYTAHLDFVRQQMDAGNIWNATASEAITYKIQKDAYQPSVSYDKNANTLTVHFYGGSSVQPYLFKTPVTINIQLNGVSFSGGLSANQGGEALSVVASSGRITVNAYPHKGTLVIRGQNSTGCTNCPPPDGGDTGDNGDGGDGGEDTADATAVPTESRVTLNGTRTGQTTLLNWSKSQMGENTNYTIERLEPNGRFLKIGTARSVQFMDESPINGVNIYRVRYTDDYGQTRHSEPVQLNFTANPNVYLAPNPATQVVSVNLREWNQAEATIYVYDVRGAEVQRVVTTASEMPYSLDLNNIRQTGQYVVRVQGADGRSATKTLLIEK
jgi:hypothetical protein